MAQPTTALFIRHLELRVHLGWPDIERQHEQIVFLDVDIHFSEPPNACKTDHLDDTLCYASLIDSIREKISVKKFHLIEHLTYDIYQSIKPLMPHRSKVSVCITKHPDIKGLEGGVQFRYSDDK